MKVSSRIFIIPVLLIVFSITTLAQEPDRHKERLEKYRSMRIAYFTENLDLTPGEAEKFWPLYNEREQQKGILMKNLRLKSKEFSQRANEMSENEAEKIIDNHIEARKKELSLDVKFHQDLKKILPAKKIMHFYITEVQFREFMLKQYRADRKQGEGKREKHDP